MTDPAATLAAIRARATEWVTDGDNSDDPRDWARGECGQDILNLIDYHAKEAK